MCQSGETFSDMTSPLQRLLHKGQKFTWTQEWERAVQKLKTALTSETVMGAFSAEHETQLVVDRGPEGIAATVMQIDPQMPPLGDIPGADEGSSPCSYH